MHHVHTHAYPAYSRSPLPPCRGNPINSEVRGAMNSLIFASERQQQPIELSVDDGPLRSHLTEGRLNETPPFGELGPIWREGRSCDLGGSTTGTTLQPAGSPATCLLWCAIALGALVRGPPVEKVSPQYFRFFVFVSSPFLLSYSSLFSR